MKSLIVAAAAMVLGTALGFLICGATVRHLRQRVRTLRRQTKTGPPKKMGVMDKVLVLEGVILVAMTLIQIAPIKLDPWSAVARAIGRAINKDVIEKLDETREILDAHIKMDGARTADAHRARILQFNNELLRDIPHTREEFIEILAEIDQYEKYCKENPDYQNNRTTHAVANISRVYDDRLIKHDFLGEDEP